MLTMTMTMTMTADFDWFLSLLKDDTAPFFAFKCQGSKKSSRLGAFFLLCEIACHTMPWASMASATFMKPATLAPFT